MKFMLAVMGVIAAALLTGHPARGQGPDAAALKKENDLLKRENDLLKRENDLLKRENDLLKKGEAKTGSVPDPDAPISVTADDVEYIYKGMVRNGADVTVTLLATSKSGEKRAPQGMMILIDGDGNKYSGMPQGGFGAPQVLREGVPMKLVWRFGPNALKQGTAPPAKITSFKSMVAESQQFAGTGVEFRDVPATLPTPKKK
jgi:hypothetical protein